MLLFKKKGNYFLFNLGQIIKIKFLKNVPRLLLADGSLHSRVPVSQRAFVALRCAKECPACALAS
jgi:hypothetical protein